ncbi:MAG: mannose-6-phosphate isomerase, class I [Treponema sp.]|nr:mannose-6-phosphate isomerase, class I [Treponema sp.]
MSESGGFYKLHNKIRHYDWGSVDAIPSFLGLENREGLPWAEMWMGTHPGAPSLAEAAGGKISLAELIAGNPEYFLGEKTARQYGELPFLFKLLAAGKPLSIQAHPNISQARAGFERENSAGLALDDPKRNYRDPNHKPEIICALTPFTMMCGFREPAEIHGFLEAFSSLRGIIAPLIAAIGSGEKPLEKFFTALFNLPGAQIEEIGNRICSGLLMSGDNTISTEQRELMLCFAEMYPRDPAILSPLYLNILTLQPGEAVFTGSGTMHSYISGFGVELMSNSDNVLRGGLTTKNVDIRELVNILDFVPFIPQIFKAPPAGKPLHYPAPCAEFYLSLLCGKMHSPEGPAVCIVNGGELEISGGATFKKGESFFIPAGGKGLDFSGDYTLYAAAAGDCLEGSGLQGSL